MYTRQCLNCQTIFDTNKLIRVYCTRACFKRAWAAKERIKLKALENTYPSVVCDKCSAKTLIDFDPVKERWKMQGHYCSFCLAPYNNRDTRTPETMGVSFGFTGSFNSTISHVWSGTFTS